MSELDAKVALDRARLAALPNDHPDRAMVLSDLCISLSERFEQLGWLPYLEEAIMLERSALELRPEGHPDRHHSLNNLAASLGIRFENLGRIADLDEAITLLLSALELRPQGHPDRSTSLSNLAASLAIRFENLGGIGDLDEAITHHRSALQLRPQGHPDRSTSLNNLAIALQTRFNHLGDISDLDEAITLHRSALELRPQGHPNRASSLHNLANSLETRFEALGGISDLDEAITHHRSALELHPEGHPRQSTSLNSLAVSLQTRFKSLKEIADLDEAITLYRSALELCPQQHSDRSTQLNNLAASLATRFLNLGGISDLDEAITLHRRVLELCPQGHRGMSLNNLAFSLQIRFKVVGRVSDLDEAITLHYSALELRPHGHPERSASVWSAASCLLQHPQTSNELNEEAFRLYSTLSDVSQSVVAVDLSAAQAWVRAAEKFGHRTILSAYQTSLRLVAIHLAALPYLPQHLGILKNHLSSLPMDAFSASIRYGTLTNAVEFLEQGRGVFWTQLTRLRSAVDEVIASGGDGQKLGETFLSVSRELRSILNSNPGDPRAWQVTNQLRETVDDIRRLPGHSRFLLPPLFSDLRHAASGGPVIVINASQYSCDGLIICHDSDPVHIPLQVTKADVRQWSLDLGTITKQGKSQEVQTDLVKILRGLWDKVVCPVVETLETIKVPHQSRIWWCPTAEFALLPLHAAGEYRLQKPKFSDLYISSYTPTLSALLRSRRPLAPTAQSLRFLAIGNGETPEQPTLEHVHEELISIRECVNPHTTFTTLEGQETQVSRTCEQLQQCEFVHFACHGIPNPAAPFESGFALADGLLKIRDIMHYDLHHSRLATLSACHATVGDKDSPDEAINLAAAMQFIGFRSVVGTMWGVEDQVAKEVMTALYRYMVSRTEAEAEAEAGGLDHTLSAVALHEALKSVKPLSLLQRILFVHIGA